MEKPGSRRSEVSEFLEPTSHSEVYFHGLGLVRPHDLELYRCRPKFVQIDSSQLCLDLQALRNLESIQHPQHYVQLQNSTTLGKLDYVHKFPPSLLESLRSFSSTAQWSSPPFCMDCIGNNQLLVRPRLKSLQTSQTVCRFPSLSGNKIPTSSFSANHQGWEEIWEQTYFEKLRLKYLKLQFSDVKLIDVFCLSPLSFCVRRKIQSDSPTCYLPRNPSYVTHLEDSEPNAFLHKYIF